MAEDDGGTRRWQRIERPPREIDPIQAVRSAIGAVRRAPRDPEARRRLHALGADRWEQLAVLLADEARAANDPQVAAALYEELADVHENLDQPIETIAAMEHVVELEPDRAEHHDRLAWLYRRADAWIKAAEAYERVAELAPDDRGRAALRAAGKLYRDHGKLDRAAAIYEAIVARRSSDADAWRALDEILTELGRWREAARVRGERAARAKGVEKAALLRSQARALEQAGDAGQAASLVAQAQDHAPDNVSGLVDYAEVLAREGKGREAADILATRIDDAVDRGAPTDDVASLRLRLYDILDEQLRDRARAELVMADLLAAAPEYLPALERIAARAAKDPDPRAHAESLLRYAAAVPDPLSRGFAILEAARRYREVGDHKAAVASFEDAAELVDDDAVRVELDDARTALAVAKAADDTRTGDITSAERRLRGILASRPYNLEANLALVALLEGAGKLDAAAAQLRDALGAAPDDVPGDRLAPIVHRFAVVMEKLGDDEESQQLLHEAHRLDRKSLVIQLALGESCFQRKIWRQAALHLGSLAEHPDAARHAEAVARGLVHAAQAEIRALRPQNAMKHYEAAARLDARCAPAWHALGEAAMERGDTVRAVEYLEREAHATTEPRDRLRLFDALGDLAADVLGDPARAERCWAQVVDLAEAPLLEKLVAAQRSLGRSSGEACERLAELVSDPKRKKALAEDAAHAYVLAGKLDRATPLVEQLIAAHPRDIDTVMLASQVAAGEPARVAQWLERALGGGASPSTAGEDAARGDAGDPRRAELWRRLGDAKRALGAPDAALAAYRRAVIAAPDSDGALAARRALVELASAAGESAVTSRMVLVEAEQDPAQVLAWARELAASGSANDACLAFDLAVALEAVLDEQDHHYLAAHPVRPMASDEAYAAPLDDAELRALVDDLDEGPLAELFELLAEATALLCPNAQSALVDADVLDAQRTSATSDAAIAAIYPQVGKALRGPPTLLYTTTRKRGPDLEVLYATPPVVIVSAAVVRVRARSRADVASAPISTVDHEAKLRCEAGRVVELSRPRRIFAAQSPEAFDLFVRGLRHAFGPAGNKVERAVVAAGERIHRTMPVVLRRRITDWFAASSNDLYDPAHQERYRAACRRAADRAGLLVCGDLRTALALAGDSAPHLIQLAASQRYFAARHKLRPRAVEETTQPFAR